MGVKRLGREADRSPPSSAEVKEYVELYLHSPNTPSWRGSRLEKAQGEFYLFLPLLVILVFPEILFSLSKSPKSSRKIKIEFRITTVLLMIVIVTLS
jgi:hypothetical protein